MKDNTCVITTVRDDDVMLRKWVEYYGGLFGKEALYVINHGHQKSVNEIAAGCNIVGIPDNRSNGFTARRWRTQNHLMHTVRQWFQHVIVCDVDEFIVVDPDVAEDLAAYMLKAPRKTVQTAVGIEILHLTDREPDTIDSRILGPRRFGQVNSWYSKPCIISRPCKLSRGGHYSSHEELNAPDGLYMLHMKYCDFGLYADTLSRRGEAIKAMGVQDVKDTTTNVQWFAKDRDDMAMFDRFCTRPIDSKWNFEPIRKKMYDNFEYRESGLYHVAKKIKMRRLFEVPERFFGIV